jgi:hypothetical protein
MVEVAVVASRVEAELAVGMLESSGIEAIILADDAGGQQPQWQMGGVRVLVAAADEEVARQLLPDDHSGDPATGNPDQGAPA